MKDTMDGARGRINSAAGMVPKTRVATKKDVGSPGPERKADVRGAQEGGSMASGGDTGNGLRAAGDELRKQHPHNYSDHGPFHGDSDHIRHSPHVMPNSKHPYGR